MSSPLRQQAFISVPWPTMQDLFARCRTRGIDRDRDTGRHSSSGRRGDRRRCRAMGSWCTRPEGIRFRDDDMAIPYMCPTPFRLLLITASVLFAITLSAGMDKVAQANQASIITIDFTKATLNASTPFGTAINGQRIPGYTRGRWDLYYQTACSTVNQVNVGHVYDLAAGAELDCAKIRPNFAFSPEQSWHITSQAISTVQPLQKAFRVYTQLATPLAAFAILTTVCTGLALLISLITVPCLQSVGYTHQILWRPHGLWHWLNYRTLGNDSGHFSEEEYFRELRDQDSRILAIRITVMRMWLCAVGRRQTSDVSPADILVCFHERQLGWYILSGPAIRRRGPDAQCLV